jgi:zinc/manganese transport system substrate-binding protein
VLLAVSPAGAQERPPQRLNIVASFSILGDFAENVGGDRVHVTTLIGPGGDPHVFEPSPADVKKVAAADVIVVNGLGFEGWLDRLVAASGTKGRIVVATRGIKLRESGDGRVDPHAWQSVENAKTYVANIRDGFVAADSENKPVYEANAATYLAKLDVLDREIRQTLAEIPPERRRAVTSHQAFGYFADAYGIAFTAPLGVSDDTEASAKKLAAIVGEIRKQESRGVFLENVADPVVLRRIADETGAAIGGTLYSDALTGPNGPAPTYIDLMRHNAAILADTLAK